MVGRLVRMTQSFPESVAVLGGGVCGLAAAWRLLRLRPGIRVVIFESEAEAGGLARSLRFGELKTDLGPHRFHTELADSLEFLRDLAGPDLMEVRRRSLMRLEGEWIDYPPRPAQMLGVLGPVRLGWFAASFAAAKARGLLSLSPSGARGAKPGERESFETIMRQAFGPALYDFLMRPYAEKVWKMPPAQIHPDTARVRVSAGGIERLAKQVLLRRKTPAKNPAALEKFLYVRGGFGSVAARMTEEIERMGGEVRALRWITDLSPGEAAPQLSAPGISWKVSHVPASPGGIATAQSVQAARLAAAAASGGASASGAPSLSADKTCENFDAVISTIPLTDLAEMLQRQRPSVDAQNSASGLSFLANILFFVESEPARFPAAQWLYFPRSDLVFNRGYLPAQFDASMAAPASPSIHSASAPPPPPPPRQQRGLICLEVTCRHGDAIWTRTDAELAARVREDAVRAGLASADSIREIHVYRIPYAYPIYDLEFKWRTDRILKWLADFPALLSAGRQGLFLHNNVDHSIFMGLRAAETLLADPLRPGPAWYRRIDEFRAFRIID